MPRTDLSEIDFSLTLTTTIPEEIPRIVLSEIDI
jgi:hypothetical protein